MAIITEKIEGKIINVELASSNLSSASYDTETKVLTVTFKTGGIYEYYDFPWDMFTRFRMSVSQGSFFSRNISKNYKYKKIG